MKQLSPLLLVTALAGSILAQQGSPPPVPQTQKPADVDVVRITTNLVQVDAVVTDNHGKVVTDLKPDEIEIFEDGHKQKITNFSYNLSVTAATETQAKAPTTDKNAPAAPARIVHREDIKRTIAIVVDDLGLSFQSIAFVRRALKKFIDEQMQPGDLVAIIRSSGGMGALQSFTTDKRQLAAAIERVKWNGNGRVGVSPFEPIEPPTPGSHGQEMDDALTEVNEFRKDVFAVGTLGAVSYVVRGLKNLPGRKSILLVSDGFRIYDDANAMRTYLASDRITRLVDEAARAAVVIYTMNATGLQTMGITAADNMDNSRGITTADTLRNTTDPGIGSNDYFIDQMTKRRNQAYDNQQSLDYLAHQTGGIAIRNTNDPSSGIRRVLEDQKGFYLIGYRPDESTFDKRTGKRTFHHLPYKVTRPGKFNVRMRNGVYGVTEDEKAAPRTLAQKL